MLCWLVRNSVTDRVVLQPDAHTKPIYIYGTATLQTWSFFSKYSQKAREETQQNEKLEMVCCVLLTLSPGGILRGAIVNRTNYS